MIALNFPAVRKAGTELQCPRQRGRNVTFLILLHQIKVLGALLHTQNLDINEDQCWYNMPAADVRHLCVSNNFSPPVLFCKLKLSISGFVFSLMAYIKPPKKTQTNPKL